MKNRLLAVIAGAGVAMILSISGFAHHGAAGLFDESRVIAITGSVVQWSFVNPHPVLVLAVTDEHGQALARPCAAAASA
jgi:hypothetical protein